MKKKNFVILLCAFSILVGCISVCAYSASNPRANLINTNYGTYDFKASVTSTFTSNDKVEDRNNAYFYINCGAHQTSPNFWEIQGFTHNGTVADITWATGTLPRKDGVEGKSLYSRVRKYSVSSSFTFNSNVDLYLKLLTGDGYSKRCALKYGYFDTTNGGDARTLIGTIYAD